MVETLLNVPVLARTTPRAGRPRCNPRSVPEPAAGRSCEKFRPPWVEGKRAKYYQLTRAGRRAMNRELKGWVSRTRAMLTLLEVGMEELR